MNAQTAQTAQTNPIQMKLAELQEAILASHPRLPILLRDIHAILRADPDNVTLLSEEEIGIVVAGLKKQTATEITAATIKPTSTTKRLKSVTADDL